MSRIVRRATLDDVPDLSRIQVESWKVAYKDILPQKLLAPLEPFSRYETWTQNISEDNEEKYSLVVEDKGEVRGFLTIGASREVEAGFESELWAIYLAPKDWGKGYGKALFHDLKTRLTTRGIKNMYVWCLKDNPIGRKYYEKMGGVEIKGLHKDFTLGGVNYPEVAYGWLKL